MLRLRGGMIVFSFSYAVACVFDKNAILFLEHDQGRAYLGTQGWAGKASVYPLVGVGEALPHSAKRIWRYREEQTDGKVIQPQGGDIRRNARKRAGSGVTGFRLQAVMTQKQIRHQPLDRCVIIAENRGFCQWGAAFFKLMGDPQPAPRQAVVGE